MSALELTTSLCPNYNSALDFEMLGDDVDTSPSHNDRPSIDKMDNIESINCVCGDSCRGLKRPCDKFLDNNDLEPFSNTGTDVVDRYGNIDGNRNETYMERPIAARRCRLSFDVHTGRQKFALRSDWYFNFIDRFNQAGYDAQNLQNIFNAMPTNIEDALKHVVYSLRVLSSVRTSHSENDMIIQNHFYRSSAHISNTLEDELWDDNKHHAYVRIRYDPQTQQRRSVTFNKTFAEMNGLHTEEMAARIGNREMPFLASNEIDFLGGMVHYVLTSRLSRTERYGRMCDVKGRAYLARVVSSKDFDAAGRLIQV